MKKRLKKPLIVLLFISVIGLVSYSLTYKGNKYLTENGLTYRGKLRVFHHYDSQPKKLVENDLENDKENVKDLALYDSPTNTGTAHNEGFQSHNGSEKTERTSDSLYDSQSNPVFEFQGSHLKGNAINKTNKGKPAKSAADFKQEQERRRNVVEKVCKEFGVERDSSEINLPASHSIYLASKDKYIDRIKMNNFYLARSASSMTCLLNKVASTTLAVALLKSDGRAIPEWNANVSPHNAVAVLHPETEAEFKFARKHFFKFFLVRHPFERLLSAYRDKVERANHWSLKWFRKHIIETLKNNSNSGNHVQVVAEEHINGTVEQGNDEAISREIKEEINETTSRNLPDQYGKGQTVSYNTVPGQKQITVPTVRSRFSELHKHIRNGSRDTSILPNNNGERSNNQRLQEEEKLSTILRSIENSTTKNKTYHMKKARLARNYQVAMSNGEVELHMHSRKISSVNRATETSSFRNKRRITPPTVVAFRDFLEYILLSKDADDQFSSHWSPFWETCSPCSVSFDVIAKLESAEEDLQMIHERMGLTKNAISEGKLNKSPDFINSKEATLASYYGQLDPTLIGRIYRRFALDFHLFEYDILDVFRLAGHCRTSVCNEMSDYTLPVNKPN